MNSFFLVVIDSNGVVKKGNVLDQTQAKTVIFSLKKKCAKETIKVSIKKYSEKITQRKITGKN